MQGLGLIRFPIGLRLFGGFFLIIGLVGIIAFTAMNQFSKLNDTLTELAAEEIGELRAFFEIELLLLDVQSDLQNALLTGEVSAFLRRTRDTSQKIGGLLDDYRRLNPAPSAEEKRLVAVLLADKEAVVGAIGEIQALIDRGESDEVRRRLVGISDSWHQLSRASVDTLIEHEGVEIEKKVAGTVQKNSETRATITALTLASVVLSLLMAGGITNSLTRPIRAMAAATDRAARGDLTSRTNIDRNDEIGLLSRHFDTMLSRLERTLLEQRQFYADASHELRTPLTVIRGEAEVARRSSKTVGEYEGALDRIIAVAHQMGGLVEELLFLARSETGQLEYRMEDVALASLIEKTAAQSEGMASLKDIHFETRLNQRVSVMGEPARIRQLIFIVLDNAIKYTEPGGRITVALEDDGVNARITVADTGVGISEEDIARVFDRFFRGETARALGRTGTGLGLAIARSIAIAHGGDIALESRIGEGTRASIHLPKRRDPAGIKDDANSSRRG